MGCTHSRNSKSKSSKDEKPMDRSMADPKVVKHFDQSRSTEVSNEAEVQTHSNYSRQVLQPEVKPKVVENIAAPVASTNLAPEPAKIEEKPVPVVVQSTTIPPDPPVEQLSRQAPPTQTYVASTYFGLQAPTEKQKSPEKKKEKKVEAAPMQPQPGVVPKKKKESPFRERASDIKGPYRTQLTKNDLECIKKAVQQRNERRAYMMAHRNEEDDTLYELETKMPERDYTQKNGTIAY
ncbi:unnamed protein product [Caenorhabditis bovis]|uniref:Uncharacterized protein n=1 Tax=Caenorhabditis bovis TaxID=2654633 RepID=A0A8S1F6Y1_9PELO|nr:unnamed protein product [Caenorhabditis bovis]